MDEQKTRRVQVTMTENCYKVVKQYAALRGMTMSECFYLALRYSLHTEALEESDVRRILQRNDVAFDEGVINKWRHDRAANANLDACFTPRPLNLIA
jgi:hypothetical protein